MVTATTTAGEQRNEYMQLEEINCESLHRARIKMEDEAYYHGFLPREESEQLLTKSGQFLVRKNGDKFILTTFHDGKSRHFIFKQTRQDRLYWLHLYAFSRPNDMIEFHHRNLIAISDKGYKLKTPFYKQDWELNHEQVEKNNLLGKGSFGEVYDGFLQSSLFGSRIPVAIKLLITTDISGDERFKFLKEANVMLPLKHENVVKLHGVCAVKEPIQIVMELAEGGSLESKLRSQTPATMDEKTNYVYGAAKGMKYLEMKSIIHRDLAARNCLLDKANQVKISDFGLSILGHEYRDKRMKNVPTRWMAPESLMRGKYSSKSDVYSFAVLMYEIYSDGRQPYEGTADKYIKKYKLEKKIHLTIAANDIPNYMESLRERCGEWDPERRPTFEEIESSVSQMPGIIHPPPPSWWTRTMAKISSYTV